MHPSVYRCSARRDVGMDGLQRICSLAPDYLDPPAGDALAAQRSQLGLPFGTSLLPRRAHEQEGKISGLSLWAVYVLLGSWAVPSAREGGAAAERAGQILPVFVIAAAFSCLLQLGARAGPAEQEGACAFLSPSLILILILTLPPDERDRHRSERRSPRTKRFSTHAQSSFHTSKPVRCNGPGLGLVEHRRGVVLSAATLSFVSCRGCIWAL